jgi:SAM-dependent methyltransferase
VNDAAVDLPVKLNLGCGAHSRPDGYIHVDREREANPDLILDIETSRWPWRDQTVDEVLLNHVMEHIGNVKWVYQETYRVLKPGGVMQINVPHHCSDHYWGDPTHVRPITIGQLSLLSQKTNRETVAKGWANSPLGLYWGVDFEVEKVSFQFTPYWEGLRVRGLSSGSLDFAIATFNNVVEQINFTLRRV